MMGAGDPEDKANYEAYLGKVSEIKAMVKRDLRALGVMAPEAVTGD
jgi:hypothetical protein